MSSSWWLQKARTRLAVAGMRRFQQARVEWFRTISYANVVGQPKLVQPAQFVGRGNIIFGCGVELGCFPSPHFLSTYAYMEARQPGAEIRIGDGTKINNGLSVIANHHRVEIGRNVRVGYQVQIFDSDFHGLRVSERDVDSPARGATVTIEDDVFLGNSVIVTKGVRIGRGAVVAVGAVVTRDVAPNTVVAGVPARQVSTL